MKAPFLSWQFGEAGVELMKRIKRTVDPRGILNPEAMFGEGGLRLSKACH
jgi:glycolate oxidase